MTGFDVDSGISDLFKNLDSLPVKVEKKLFRKGLKQIADNLVTEAKSYVPVQTGNLRDSIKALVSLRKNKGGAVATIGSDLFYARFVELGFMHAGTPTVHVPARPFLTPVFEGAFDTAMAQMREFLAQEIPREMARDAKKRVR